MIHVCLRHRNTPFLLQSSLVRIRKKGVKVGLWTNVARHIGSVVYRTLQDCWVQKLQEEEAIYETKELEDTDDVTPVLQLV